MTVEAALVDIAQRLERRRVDFALVGGLAVSIRAEVRFTRDVDLAIRVASDSELEALTRSLSADGFTLAAVVEQDEQKRVAIARLRAPSGIVIDLLAASSGIEPEIVDAATTTEALEGIRIAKAEHLLAMKVLSMRGARLQDRIDARNLIEMAGPALDEVRLLLALIEERGFARGQALGAKLDRFLASLSEDGADL